MAQLQATMVQEVNDSVKYAFQNLMHFIIYSVTSRIDRRITFIREYRA